NQRDGRRIAAVKNLLEFSIRGHPQVINPPRQASYPKKEGYLPRNINNGTMLKPIPGIILP
ncbi:MAG: hypothetical protein WBC11_06315, partial [Dehalococcoidia bacterium]